MIRSPNLGKSSGIGQKTHSRDYVVLEFVDAAPARKLCITILGMHRHAAAHSHCRAHCRAGTSLSYLRRDCTLSGWGGPLEHGGNDRGANAAALKLRKTFA